MNRTLLKLYAFNFFQSQTQEHSPHHVFGFAFLFVFYFYFRSARFPAFLFARANLPIESKVLSRVARTNYRRTKQGYYMSSWTIPVADPGKGPKTEARRPEKFFWDQPPPLPPLSDGLDSPLHSVTLTKWISYSYIYKFYQQKLFSYYYSLTLGEADKKS